MAEPSLSRNRTTLKLKSKLIRRYSEELANEGPPPAEHAPEALEDLGKRVVKKLISSGKKMVEEGYRDRLLSDTVMPPVVTRLG